MRILKAVEQIDCTTKKTRDLILESLQENGVKDVLVDKDYENDFVITILEPEENIII